MVSIDMNVVVVTVTDTRSATMVSIDINIGVVTVTDTRFVM